MTTAERTTDKDTGHRTYTYPPTGEQLVSVTTVLDATEGKQMFLTPWSARLAAEYAVDNLAVLEAVLRDEGRGPAVKLAKDQARLIREIKADAGSYVHEVVERLVLWAYDTPGARGADIALPLLPEHLADADYDDDPLEDVVDWMITGFLNFVSDWKPVFQAAEMTVFHQPLGIAGTLDLIVRFDGYGIGNAGRFIAADGSVTPCIDVKTGKHWGATWCEQIATYRRMRECLLPMGEIHPMPRTDCGAVLHLRPEYERGYWLMPVAADDDADAWETFQSALSTFRKRAARRLKPGKVTYPKRADGTIPQPRLADLAGEGYGRALAPLVKARIADLEQLAAMKAGDCLAVKGVGGKVLDIIRLMLADHGLHLAGETTTATGEAA
jgi:hypothetical protein